MSAYWKSFWGHHLDTVGEDPFRRVGRTLHQQPMSEAMFAAFASHVTTALDLDASHRVLDLCCGNGLLTGAIAPHCARVVAADFSPKLAIELASRAPANVSVVVADALDLEFRPGCFDRILFAAALQHFSQPEAIKLFRRLGSWLDADGLLLVTDICDADRIWRFFDTAERQDLYFARTADETPLLGTWFARDWLRVLARHAGFAAADVVDQPADYWYAHYRFDLLCRMQANSTTS